MQSKPRTALHQVVVIELARAGIDQRTLAARLGVAPTTLSSWLTAAVSAPSDLSSRIEDALGLPAGRLTSADSRSAA